MKEQIPFEGLNGFKSKSLIYAVLEKNTDGKRFAVISTHFWWQRGEKFDRRREENARTFGIIAYRIRKEYNVPIIVT